MNPETYLYNYKNEEIITRASAIIEAGKTGDRSAIKSLVSILENKGEIDWLRGCAATALGRLAGEEAIPALIDALKDDNNVVSRAVISAFGDIKSQKATPFLLKILENKCKEELHAITVTVLGEIGGYEVIPTLLQALESSNERVRVSAARSLSEFQTEEATSRFLILIKDTNECLRAIAASSLGLIGDKCGVKPLMEALHDDTETVRAIAASSLGCIGERGAIPSLEESLGDMSEIVRKQAAAALLKIRSREEPGKD
jgi:HEAT repeat protein